MIRALLLVLALLAAGPSLAQPVGCRETTHAGTRYAICVVDMAQADLRLFLHDTDGLPFGHFHLIDRALAPRGERLLFAMNAGMYHENRDPVGYYVESGTELMRVVPNAGPGNFGMLPNGILCIRPGRADVIETLAFQKLAPDCRYATQSGPMLVIDGALHPRFLPDSTSRYIRNGVGTSADGLTAVFAISRSPVTFHDFASLFRDGLNLPNALYLDGNISRLYAPEIGRDDPGRGMGPVVGVVVPLSD